MTNQVLSDKESIRIIPSLQKQIGLSPNGTVTFATNIKIIIDNFKHTENPLTIQIFNPKGGIYKTDYMQSNNIQPTGLDYGIYIKGTLQDMGQYKVVIRYENVTAETDEYLTNIVPLALP
jgi:hypothetical protein